MALKLDMSKAYDRLEWEFAVATLCSMGFPRPLVKFIYICISSISYQIFSTVKQAKASFLRKDSTKGTLSHLTTLFYVLVFSKDA